MRHSAYLILFFLFTLEGIAQQEKTVVFGKITDSNNHPLELVNVSPKGSQQGTVSDAQGKYRLYLKPADSITLQFSFIGFETRTVTINLQPGEKKELNITIDPSSTMLNDVIIEDKRIRRKSITAINPKAAGKIPGMNNSIEALVKTMPGVSSKNEMSNQYSVRGGNFDENLIYVNGIRIYRPFLVRSGRQEGLSFINSDLVSSVLFSAGGFDAKYGDKMSSVLDITYKKPSAFAGSVSGSLLGGSFHIEDATDDRKLSYLLGVRQKSNQYVLNSLQTEGEYQPSFTDIQGMVNYTPNENWEFTLLGNMSRNVYRFTPENRTTDFGTFQEALRLQVFFDGQEVDKYLTYTGGLSAIYKPFPGMKLKLMASAYTSDENESFDIRGDYWIGQLNTNLGQEEFGEVIEKQGVGTYLNHARNELDVDVVSIEHQGEYFSEAHEMEWGIKYQQERIADHLREWNLLDSAGYTLPYPNYTPGETIPEPYPLQMQGLVSAQNETSSNRFSAYFQDSWELSRNYNISLTTGLRASYWDFNEEFLLSPRASISFKPQWKRDILFRFSSGYYYQPPFYKEMRRLDGTLNQNIKSQKSIHFLLGSDWNFRAWGRPFKFVTEVFYKHLDNLIPYEIDNVRVRYFADMESTGYSTGIDMKVNGEFVKGVESWASLSLMTTQEDIEGDYYLAAYNESGELITPETEDREVAYREEKEIGFRPRPLDQRVSFSLFFQDYLPKNPTYKMNLSLHYSTGLPVNIPGTKNYKGDTRIPSYRRVDIGFAKQIMGEGITLREGHFLNHFKSMWVSLEVFNLLQIKNTISYFWVTDVSNNQLAVPNYLTPRQVNLKLNIGF